MDFIETPVKKQPKPPKLGYAKTKTIKKEKVSNMSKEQFKQTKSAHKAEIAKLKQDIKKHKLLIKQAKLVYKISKMKEEQ